jgi:hypothetical protein
MSHPENSDSTSLPVSVVERVLSRAAQLDATYRDGTLVSQTRAAAVEAGIAAQAFDAALREVTARDALAAGRSAVPLWVRACLFGVVDRRAAMAFYWLFVAVTLLLAPAVAAALPARLGTGVRMGMPLLISGFGLFSLWSTSRAIRWADRHGWENLP